MKRALAVIFAFLLTASMISCGNDSTDEKTNETQAQIVTDGQRTRKQN